MTRVHSDRTGSGNVASLFPDFGGFNTNHQFSTFLENLPKCFGRPAFLGNAHELWGAVSGDVIGDNALEEFTTILRHYSFERPKPESHIEPEKREKLLNLGKTIADLVPKSPDENDRFHYFPAGQPFFESLEETLGPLNPIPPITEGLRAIFEKQDSSQADIETVELSPELEALLADLIEWTALQQEEQTRDAVRSALRMCCGLPEHYRGSDVERGSVQSLLIALVCPDPLRNLAIDRWGSDLDFDTDNRVLQGMGILSRYSFNSWIDLGVEDQKLFKDVGVELTPYAERPIPISILSAIMTCLYCRWIDGDEKTPDWACELPRLFSELDEIGADMEGRSPLPADEAYLLADILYKLENMSPDLLGGLDPSSSAYVCLARATWRCPGLFDPNYFDVREYIPLPDALTREDPASRFAVFREFGQAAEEIGLRRLSAASMSFYLITQAAAFDGELKTDWNELQGELERLMHGPGHEFVEAAISTAIQLAEENGVDINAIRLREVAGPQDLGSGAHNVRSILSVAKRDPRADAELDLVNLIGDAEWHQLLEPTREQLIDGWVQVMRNRAKPVNLDVSGWGPIAMHFTNALEHDLSHRVKPIINSSSLVDLYASFGPKGRPPKKWTFGAIVNLLLKYSQFDTDLNQATKLAGLRTLCTEGRGLLSRIHNNVVELRNWAVHPGDKPPFTEAQLSLLLVELFTNQLISSYARCLIADSRQ